MEGRTDFAGLAGDRDGGGVGCGFEVRFGVGLGFGIGVGAGSAKVTRDGVARRLEAWEDLEVKEDLEAGRGVDGLGVMVGVRMLRGEGLGVVVGVGVLRSEGLGVVVGVLRGEGIVVVLVGVLRGEGFGVVIGVLPGEGFGVTTGVVRGAALETLDVTLGTTTETDLDMRSGHFLFRDGFWRLIGATGRDIARLNLALAAF